ncbi:MAG: MotA/TolQ/ExbB proton channel family protein [Clostridiales bacterium]
MVWNAIIKNLLHGISQGLLIPTIIILLILSAISIIVIGSLLAEILTERKLLKANIPQLLSELHGKSMEEMSAFIQQSLILKRQKQALLELIKYRSLPAVELEAIAKRLIATEESHYEKIIGRTDLISKIAPMFGLMGTLIPLGPGLLALGQGDTKTLSDSLLVAFDTTVAGLASAVVCYAVSKLRRRWYEDYMVSIESMMECILEEAHPNV